MSCPNCGGPLNLAKRDWRASCMECGYKPYPMPAEQAAELDRIAAMDVDEARALIAAERAGTGVEFDPR